MAEAAMRGFGTACGVVLLGGFALAGASGDPTSPEPPEGAPSGSAAPAATPAPGAAAEGASAASPERWAGPAAPAGEPLNLTSLAAGARIVREDDGVDGVQAIAILDEWLPSIWQGVPGGGTPMEVVVELAARSRLDRVELHLTGGWHYEALEHAPKLVTVEVSDAEGGPWRPLTTWTPTETPSTHVAALSPAPEGRYVRVTIPTNQGGGEPPFLSHLGVSGVPVAESAKAPPVVGRFAGSWLLGSFEIFEANGQLRGCFPANGVPIDVALDGRTLTMRWKHDDGSRYGALLTPESDRMWRGIAQQFDAEGTASDQGGADAERVEDRPSLCEGRDDTGRSALEGELQAEGRAVVYNLLFDFGSDRLRPESNAVIDELAAILTRNPEWRLLVDGHTDAVGSDASNLDLSKRRAAATVRALTSRGIDAARLRSDGHGEGKPVADNATAPGRALNRRVELVKE